MFIYMSEWVGFDGGWMVFIVYLCKQCSTDSVVSPQLVTNGDCVHAIFSKKKLRS